MTGYFRAFSLLGIVLLLHWGLKIGINMWGFFDLPLGVLAL
jgi:hypothetical protein